MDSQQYIEHLRRDSRRLADAAEGNLRARVPACPDWDVADLVWHVSTVDAFWTAMASGGHPDHYDHAERPSDETLIAWYAGVAERLADTLSTLPPEAECWTWSQQKDVAFVQRRMAQETAVHAWDAVDAGGVAEPIDAALAADGVDEYLEHHLPDDGFADGPAVTIHLHATDVDGDSGEWFIAIGDGEYAVEHTHAKGDVAVRATASDLLLMLWGRAQPDAGDRFAVFGDPGALSALRGDND